MSGWMAPGGPAPPEFIVAFRTHVWDEHVAYLARKLYGYAAGARFIILADETNGALDTSPFEKLSHTQDFSGFGLPAYPPNNPLWFNSDYPLYPLRQAFPHAARYAMVEYDVAVNVDITRLMQHALDHGMDMLAHDIRPAGEDWVWRQFCVAHFPRVYRALIPVLIMSGRGIDALLARRQAMAAAKPPADYMDWPFCEPFIPSTLAEIFGPHFGELREHAKLPFYDWTNPRHLNEPAANRPGTICHPILGGRHFALKRMAYEKPDGILNPASLLRQKLPLCDPADFIKPLSDRIKSLRSREAFDQFIEIVRANRWPETYLRDNLALFKPATQSSICQWSHGKTVEEDAGGGNNGVINGSYGFHTDHENAPWWQVDLQAVHLIGKVIIYNRLDMKERCTRLTISGSADGETWAEHATKTNDALFGGADGQPLVFNFLYPITARFIRVTMIGEGILHLDEIEVHGPDK
jgi:hypothetical protein